MLHGARIAVAVPAYNEARLIERTLANIPPFVDHVIVIDDASRDRTADAARAVPDRRIRVIEHEINRGVGAAIATGYRFGVELGADVVAVMAGDAQMDPKDLEHVVTPVARGEVDYCKGDRLSHPSVRATMPRHRFVANHVLSRLTSLALGMIVRDSQCGYTAISRAAIARIQLGRLWPGYGYPNDLLGRLVTARLRVREVTVRPIYADEESGVRLRHGLFVIPFLLARTALERRNSQ